MRKEKQVKVDFKSEFIGNIGTTISSFREGYIEKETLEFLEINKNDKIAVGKLTSELFSIEDRDPTKSPTYGNSVAKIANIVVAFNYIANELLKKAKANNSADLTRLNRYVGITNQLKQFVINNKDMSISITTLPKLYELQKKLKDDILKTFTPDSKDKTKTIPQIQAGNDFEYLFAILYQTTFEKISEILDVLIDQKKDSSVFEKPAVKLVTEFRDNNNKRVTEIRQRIKNFDKPNMENYSQTELTKKVGFNQEDQKRNRSGTLESISKGFGKLGNLFKKEEQELPENQLN